MTDKRNDFDEITREIEDSIKQRNQRDDSEQVNSNVEAEAQEAETSNRQPREVETRARDTRPSDAWIPPSHLPKPEPEEGWIFRWIRTATFDRADVRNVSRRMREGWVPVLAKDYPELQLNSDIDSRWPEGIEVGGLLLCKAPASLKDRRNEYYQKVNEDQMRAVDEDYMREQDSRFPKFSEKKSRTTFGGG